MKNFRIGDWISKKLSRPYGANERGQSADGSVEEPQDPRNGKGAPNKGQSRESRFSGRQNDMIEKPEKNSRQQRGMVLTGAD